MVENLHLLIGFVLPCWDVRELCQQSSFPARVCVVVARTAWPEAEKNIMQVNDDREEFKTHGKDESRNNAQTQARCHFFSECIS